MVSVSQIPNLPPTIGAGGSELFETVQAGVSRRITLGQIAAYANGLVPPVGLSAPPANLLPGGGAAFPREQSFRVSANERVFRGGASYGVEDFNDNTTFQSYTDTAPGLRIIVRTSGDATKRWNFTTALPTNQMVELCGQTVCFGLTGRAGSGMVASVTAEILETVELGAWGIYDADGYYPSNNNIVATTTFTPGQAATRYGLSGTLSANAMSCAIRVSANWVDCAAGADFFLSNLYFGLGDGAPVQQTVAPLTRFQEGLYYNRTTYARGVPPGQPNTIPGSLAGNVITLGGSDLGCSFNFRNEMAFTPRVKTYSPVSGDVGVCYNETTGFDNIPITLADTSDTGVIAYFSRTTNVAVGDRIRVHIEAEV